MRDLETSNSNHNDHEEGGCNPVGAGKWKEEYSKILQGKKVVVLQDDDEPGHNAACQRLAASVAAWETSWAGEEG